MLAAGTRCLVVEDVVTTGGSTVRAIERIREEGLEVAGVTAVVDRLAGGAEAIEKAAGAPYRPLRHDRRALSGPAGPRLARGLTPQGRVSHRRGRALSCSRS